MEKDAGKSITFSFAHRFVRMISNHYTLKKTGSAICQIFFIGIFFEQERVGRFYNPH